MRQLQSTTPLQLTLSDASYKYCNKAFYSVIHYSKKSSGNAVRKICTFSKIRKKKRGTQF